MNIFLTLVIFIYQRTALCAIFLLFFSHIFMVN